MTRINNYLHDYFCHISLTVESEVAYQRVQSSHNSTNLANVPKRIIHVKLLNISLAQHVTGD